MKRRYIKFTLENTNILIGKPKGKYMDNIKKRFREGGNKNARFIIVVVTAH